VPSVVTTSAIQRVPTLSFRGFIKLKQLPDPEVLKQESETSYMVSIFFGGNLPPFIKPWRRQQMALGNCARKLR
jgi:hypothetical protein